MKVRLLSDLHMEGQKFFYEYAGEDVLLLAGDIYTRNRHDMLLDQIPQYVKVVMVAGNHEYYNTDMVYVKAYLKELEGQYNFHFLDNEALVIGDLNIFGGTMFTDFQLDGLTEAWFARKRAQDGIADFFYMKRNEIPWTTADHEAEHTLFCKELAAWLRATEGQKRLVMTHFMPHPKCTNIRFAGSILNPYFAADMTPFMGWEGTWVHGHGHDPVDFMEGETRVLCNPKGYGTENMYGFINQLVFEV